MQPALYFAHVLDLHPARNVYGDGEVLLGCEGERFLIDARGPGIVVIDEDKDDSFFAGQYGGCLNLRLIACCQRNHLAYLQEWLQEMKFLVNPANFFCHGRDCEGSTSPISSSVQDAL